MVKAPSVSAVLCLVDDHQQNLAIELAAKLQTSKEILERYGLTKKAFTALAATPKFKKQYKDAQIAWGSSLNARERVAQKSAMISEGGLLRLNQIIHDTATPPSNVIEAHKHVSNLGAVMPTKATEAGEDTNRHQIIINIGKSEGREPITVEGTVLEHEDGE